MQTFPTAKHLADAKPKKIEKIVRNIQGNHFNIRKIQELIDTERNSIYSGMAKTARATTLRILIYHIKTLSGSIKELEAQMKAILSASDNDDSFPTQSLLSITGVGEKTLAALISYLDHDGSNFPEDI